MCEGTAEGVHAALGGAEHLGVLALHPTPEYMIPGHVEDDAARGLDVHQLDRLPGGEYRAAQIHGEKPVELLDAGKASRVAGEDVCSRVVHPDVHASRSEERRVGKECRSRW